MFEILLCFPTNSLILIKIFNYVNQIIIKDQPDNSPITRILSVIITYRLKTRPETENGSEFVDCIFLFNVDSCVVIYNKIIQ